MRQHGHVFHHCYPHRCRFRPPDNAKSSIQEFAHCPSSVLTYRPISPCKHSRQRTEHTSQPTSQTVAGLLRVEPDGQERLPQSRNRLRDIAGEFDQTLDTFSPSGFARLLEGRGRCENIETPSGRHDTPRLCRVQPIVDVRQFVQIRQRSGDGVSHQRPDGLPDRRRRGGGTLQRRHREQTVQICTIVPCRTGKPLEPAPQRFGAHDLVKLLGLDEIDEGRAPG